MAANVSVWDELLGGDEEPSTSIEVTSPSARAAEKAEASGSDDNTNNNGNNGGDSSDADAAAARMVSVSELPVNQRMNKWKQIDQLSADEKLARELEAEEFGGFKNRRDFDGIRRDIALSKEEAARLDADVRAMLAREEEERVAKLTDAERASEEAARRLAEDDERAIQEARAAQEAANLAAIQELQRQQQAAEEERQTKRRQEEAASAAAAALIANAETPSPAPAPAVAAVVTSDNGGRRGSVTPSPAVAAVTASENIGRRGSSTPSPLSTASAPPPAASSPSGSASSPIPARGGEGSSDEDEGGGVGGSGGGGGGGGSNSGGGGGGGLDPSQRRGSHATLRRKKKGAQSTKFYEGTNPTPSLTYEMEGPGGSGVGGGGGGGSASSDEEAGHSRPAPALEGSDDEVVEMTAEELAAMQAGGKLPESRRLAKAESIAQEKIKDYEGAASSPRRGSTATGKDAKAEAMLALQAEMDALKATIKDWKKSFMLEYHRPPTHEDTYSGPASKKIKKTLVQLRKTRRKQLKLMGPQQ